jgi:MFS family permease
MSPDNLRKLSWKTFVAMFGLGVLGAVVLVAVPDPGYKSHGGNLGRFIAISGLALIGLAVLANIISQASGFLAWRRGARFCGWIIICALLLYVPAAVLIALILNK